MKKLMQKVTGVALVTLMAASSAGLGAFAAEDGADQIVNIGVTDSLGGVNPLMMDQTEINKYAADLQFLPLVELDPELNFQAGCWRVFRDDWRTIRPLPYTLMTRRRGQTGLR